MTTKVLLPALAAAAVALFCFEAQTAPATGVLKGVVKDKVTKEAIGGVSVRAQSEDAQTALGATRTNQDGTYTLPGLAIGKRALVTYSAGGYAPPSWSLPISISKPETVQDVSLWCDCARDAYWKAWAGVEADNAKKYGTDSAAAAISVDAAWKVLGYIGISAETRSMAARNLLSVSPIADRNSAIVSYANTDPVALRLAEESIGSEVRGGTVQATDVRLPPEVAAEILAAQVRKQDQPGSKGYVFSFDKLEPGFGSDVIEHTRDILKADQVTKSSVDKLVVKMQDR